MNGAFAGLGSWKGGFKYEGLCCINQAVKRIAIKVVPTTTSLLLLVDRSGVKVLAEGGCKIRKHVAYKGRQ